MMKRIISVVLLAIIVLTISGCTTNQVEGFPVAAPEEQGVDSEGLISTLEYIENNSYQVHSIQMVRNGHLIMDCYFYPYQRNMLHDTASVTKSITSLLAGIAIEHKVLSGIDQSMPDLFPLVTDEPPPSDEKYRRFACLVHGVGQCDKYPYDSRRGEITLGDLLAMTSGFDYGYHKSYSDFRDEYEDTDSLFLSTLSMELADNLTHENDWSYNSGNYHLIGCAITMRTQQTLHEYAIDNLFEKMDITNTLWSADVENYSHGWGDLFMYPMDMMKLGSLVLAKGLWQDKQLISSDWIAESTKSVTLAAEVNSVTQNQLNQLAIAEGRKPEQLNFQELDYGLGWWIRNSGGYQWIEARGRGGQTISISRELNTVIVLTGDEIPSDDIMDRLAASISKNDREMPDNKSAAERLADKIEDVSRPPETIVMEIPEDFKNKISNTYYFSENPLNLSSVSGNVKDNIVLEMEVDIGGNIIKFDTGLDKNYRFSPSLLFSPDKEGLIQGAIAKRITENELEIEVYDISCFEKHKIIITFAENKLYLNVDGNILTSS